MDNNELRRLVESEIRSKTRNRDFKEKHMEFYDKFFNIFSGLGAEYRKQNSIKDIRPIDFIEQNGRLAELLEIVRGNQIEVRKKHFDQLRKEAENNPIPENIDIKLRSSTLEEFIKKMKNN